MTFKKSNFHFAYSASSCLAIENVGFRENFQYDLGKTGFSYDMEFENVSLKLFSTLIAIFVFPGK